MKQQRGFTLLELMVAMAIFAMLAVVGWQVFDSVNRARERAQYHADNLAVLQYAYLQLQQDMGQVIAYQAPSAQDPSTNNTANTSTTTNDATIATAVPFMNLNSEHINFVRFADPDPRYQSSPSVQHIEYIFVDQQLIRRQYMSVQGGRDSVSLDSVLLEGVTAPSWQAHLPEVSSKFPNTENSDNQTTLQANNTATGKAETKLLPKGVGVSFTYQDMPITWQWALIPQPAPHKSNTPTNSADNANGNSNNNGNNTGDTNNENNNNENNNSSGNNNTPANTPIGQ